MIGQVLQAVLLGGHVMFLVVLFGRLALGSGSFEARVRYVVRRA